MSPFPHRPRCGTGRVAVQQLIRRLLATPVRQDGVLDLPLDEFVEDVVEPDVADLFDTYTRGRRQPTLRVVLEDPRFQRWTDVAARSPLRAKVEAELTIVSHVIEEEESFLGGPSEPAPLATRPTSASSADARRTVREWAAEVGVSARLSDPAGVLLAEVESYELSRALRDARRATVGDVLDANFATAYGPVEASIRRLLALVAERYVRDAAERVLADRREEERVRALGHVPEGEGPAAFLAALDLALASTPSRGAQRFTSARVEFDPNPPSVIVQAPLPPDRYGRARDVVGGLALESWRTAKLAKMVHSNVKEGRTSEFARFMLAAVRRVVVDPGHPHHAVLVAYLDEPPWSRVLANLTSLAKSGALAAADCPVEWRLSGERNLSLAPFIRTAEPGREAMFRPTSSQAILLGPMRVSAADEAAARAHGSITSTQGGYSYGYAYAHGEEGRLIAEAEVRDRLFRTLAALVGRDNVRGRGGVALEVHLGPLGASLVEESDGFRFAFDVGGETIGASDLRASLDARGDLVHVDLARGRVLLARVGRQRAAVLSMLASEDAVFPESSGRALVEHVVAVDAVVPIALPQALAGEPVVADSRPVVRVERTGFAALSISWLVRPIAGGRVFVAGEGPVQVLQQAGGRGVFAARSHAEERRRLEALRGRLPASIAEGPLERARCEGIEPMLAVLATLRGAAESGEAIVEWPKTLPRVVGDASWSKLRLRVTAERDWFGVNGGVEVDGVQVSLADLLAARRHGERYLVVGPDKLVAIEEELRSRLGDLEAIARPSKKGLELARASVPALAELVASREQLDAAPPFWSLLERIDAARASDPRVPRGFSKVLRGYQVDGFRWMSRLAAWGAGACLADEMGLGKTVQALALLVARSKEGPALVVAPTSVGPNWMHEATRFAPSLRAVLHRGAGRATAFAKLGAGDLVVTSYDVLARDVDALSKVTFSTIMLDEAQAIKNGDTTRARAARCSPSRLSPRPHGHAGREPARRALQLDGVPQSGFSRERSRVSCALRRPDRARPGSGGERDARACGPSVPAAAQEGGGPPGAPGAHGGRASGRPLAGGAKALRGGPSPRARGALRRRRGGAVPDPRGDHAAPAARVSSAARRRGVEGRLLEARGVPLAGERAARGGPPGARLQSVHGAPRARAGGAACRDDPVRVSGRQDARRPSARAGSPRSRRGRVTCS